MTIHAHRGVIGLAIATVLATAACTDPAAPPTTTTAAPPIGTPTTTTSTTAEDPLLAVAEAAVAKLWALVDALGADPQRSLDELTTVARDQSLETWREVLIDQRRRGYKQIGSTAIVSSKASATGGRLTVETCVDVTKSNLVDKDGKSVVAANRPPRVRYTSVVARGSDGKFYVIQDEAVGQC